MMIYQPTVMVSSFDYENKYRHLSTKNAISNIMIRAEQKEPTSKSLLRCSSSSIYMAFLLPNGYAKEI